MNRYKASIFEILALNEHTTSRYFKANSLLLNILSLIFKDIDFDEKNWGKESIVDEVKFYLDVNYAEKIKLLDTARMFGIHPNYLTRIFHKKFGISPKQYLLNLKLKKACRLLTTTRPSIFIIASSLGFDDQLAFSKSFKKKYSLSPSNYRNISHEL